ncbi:hypothetical protein IAT40_006676 [Kwoniella sp. CBS 6097]
MNGTKMSATPFRLTALARPAQRSINFNLTTIPNQVRLIHSSYSRSFPTSQQHPPSPTSLSHTAHPTPPHQQPHVTSHPSTTASHAHGHQHGHGAQHAPPRSGSGSGKKRSPHMVWYREIVPAMVPIFLISTTLFLSLSLIRTHLSHSKSLSESTNKIEELEAQLAQLRLEQRRARVREKKERERILPLVVERVLQRVGVVGGEEEGDQADEEDDYVEEQKELPRLL